MRRFRLGVKRRRTVTPINRCDKRRTGRFLTSPFSDRPLTYSLRHTGATLLRPGLDKVRDLAAEGQIDAVLLHSPDRLSRKYAYQVLGGLIRGRQGMRVRLMKAKKPNDEHARR
jgi:hypothetical protein